MKLSKLIFITTIITNIATIIGAIIYQILLGRLSSSLPFNWEWFVYKDIVWDVTVICGMLTLFQIGFLFGMGYVKHVHKK